jgi:hypothetical protein
MKNMRALAKAFIVSGFLAAVFLSQGCVPRAVLVIGQPDFTSSDLNQGKGSAANNTLAKPVAPVAIYQDSLFIADAANDRILKFAPIPKTNNASAAAVIRSSDPNKWRNFGNPYAVQIVDGKMFVADVNNSRVLIWNTVPTGNETPDVVLGQKDLTSEPIADCSHMQEPRGLFAAGGRLIVSDSSNNRILIWNSIPNQTNATNPAAADVVLGKSDCSADETGSTRHTFNQTKGVWSDGTRLVVADSFNHRVLIWNRLPGRSTDDADIVLGTGKAGTGRNQFNEPYGVYSDGTRLFVADSENNRVLLWEQFPSKDGDLPGAVIGQSNFNRSGKNGSERSDGAPGQPSDSVLNEPESVYYKDGQLWVTERGNNRVLLFLVK